jgi:hypothetical protein
MSKTKLKPAPSDGEARQKRIHTDRERLHVLAGGIYPGAGCMMDSDEIPEPLIEILSIISSHTSPDDRDYLIFSVAEVIYPATEEGMTTIEAFVERCAARGRGKGRK